MTAYYQNVHTNSNISPAEAEKLNVIKREGHISSFDPDKIRIAITKSFLAVEGDQAQNSERIHEIIDGLVERVLSSLSRRLPEKNIHIEDIQDQVELALMRGGHQKVARSYVIYREERAKRRLEKIKEQEAKKKKANEDIIVAQIKLPDNSTKSLYLSSLEEVIVDACQGLDAVSSHDILQEVRRSIYNNMSEQEVSQTLIYSVRQMVEKDPAHSFVASRLLLNSLRSEALSCVFGNSTKADTKAMKDLYPIYFKAYIDLGISVGMLTKDLRKFDLDYLGKKIKSERDLNFSYLGLQTLYDRYFLHKEDVRYELPQAFFMRVAMGLSLDEKDPNEKVLEFYDLISSFRFMCSTPTLFNSGTKRPQLSSCFLTTVGDDLAEIFKGIKDNALLAKYSGGLGNDWTAVRGLGSKIRGTNGKSQGVIPFLKVANDTAVAVNQGGKRKGAACAYLETWHIDVEEFLELRKNTGDERRRTHDLNTANWIPDLFMKRVEEGKEWTLFSPDEVFGLHDLYGEKFNRAYEVYEEKARKGEIKNYKIVSATQLWRKMLTMLYETGHPWLTFKDPCNIRSPQSHCGVVHSSNLCTEITLNTSADEIAVCNLGSINLAAHTDANGIDFKALRSSVRTAMRMLDNVIDINFYTVPEARNANQKHRPVGLGLMGFQDALSVQRIPYASEEAVVFADQSTEVLSYYALEASSDLALERGVYSSFEGSLWSRGILPIDSLKILGDERGVEFDNSQTMDWEILRQKIKSQGIRNSNNIAIAPTATIANICGVTQSIEPTYQNLFVKSNMSGNFTVVNTSLVEDLKKLGLWDNVMIADLKYFDGVLSPIARIPDDIKNLYATAFEVHWSWLVRSAAARQKWIDQSQSVNFYVAEPSGSELDKLYRAAWSSGLKCTYYLRSIGASHVEKSTLATADNKLNAVKVYPIQGISSCRIDDPDCESCQ